jgi:hypothetical protein
MQWIGKLFWCSGWSLLGLGILVIATASSEIGSLLVGLGSLFVLLVWLIPFTSARLLRSGSPDPNEERTYSFTPGGIRFSTPSVSSSMSWASVVRVVETRKFFLFCMSRAAAWYIPKRGLTQPDAAKLRTLVHDYAGRGTLLEPHPGTHPDVDVGAEQIRVVFHWTVGRLFRATLAASRHGVAYRWLSVFMLGYLVVLVLPAILAQRSFGSILFQLAPIPIVLAAGPIGGLLYAYRHLQDARTARGPQVISIGTSGVRAEGSAYEAAVRWEGLWKIIESQSFFLFFLSKAVAIPLPKHELSGTSEVERVRDFLRSTAGTKFASKYA